ncbi:MAG: type secretion system major pseudopilin GspG [Verrucomicrobiota bacterium]|jgi:general secretion pathway protein G
MKRSFIHRSSRGFTLIEIMLVVGIITVLMGSAIFMLTGNLEFAKEKRAEGDMQALATQVRLYEMKNSGRRLGSGGLQALVDQKLLESLPLDPWGNGYGYKADSSAPKGFVLYSFGPDGKDDGGGGDDIAYGKRK